MTLSLWFGGRNTDDTWLGPRHRPVRARGLSAGDARVGDGPALDAAERRLVERMRAGEHAAFEEVIRRHHAELVGYAATLVRSRAEADDLLQAVFLRLWRGREALRVTQGIRAYLYGAVRNQAWNQLRGERRRRDATERFRVAAAEEPAGERDASDVGDAEQDPDAELLARVATAIERLPARAKEVWHLHHDRGLTYAAVAEVMGVSVGTVKSQMARAVGLIRAAVEPLLAALIVLRL